MSQPTPEAELHLPGQTPIRLPLKAGSYGQQVLDIKPLAAQKLYTFDPGFMATAACESAITYIDGHKGRLLYRGRDVDELTEHHSYLDVAHGLMTGQWSGEDLPEWRQRMQDTQQELLPWLHQAFSSAPEGQHPMGVLAQAWSMLAAKEQAHFQPHDPAYALDACVRALAAAALFSGLCAYQYTQRDQMLAPSSKTTSYAEQCLRLLSDRDTLDPVLIKAFDAILILHADHEQNASTSTVRMVASTGANPFACIAAGVCSLWGPAHGGANEACLSMLETIGTPDRIPEYIARAKDRQDPFRLMGFGHRVYKNLDPRARVMRELCPAVLKATGRGDEPLFKLAMDLERIALEDDYFVERNLYPNIDFYSGITLKALGIPKALFTVIFALARTSGWMAHWLEYTQGDQKRISRPRQLYTGPES